LQKWWVFKAESANLGGKQTNPKIFQEMKSLNALDVFSCPKYIQSSIIGGVCHLSIGG
jgi:hypothetical protein